MPDLADNLPDPGDAGRSASLAWMVQFLSGVQPQNVAATRPSKVARGLRHFSAVAKTVPLSRAERVEKIIRKAERTELDPVVGFEFET